MPLLVLLLDHEPIARRILREELESQQNAEVAGDSEAGAHVGSLQPGLLN
jgi:hypothetical protein